MKDYDFESCLQDIFDADMLIAHLRHLNGGARYTEMATEIRELEAKASLMRGLKHHYELKALAETTGSTLPEYDSAAITKPIGDAVRRRFEELRGAA